MNFDEIFSKKFNKELADEVLNVLSEDLTTPYKILTLKIAELYAGAEPGARKEALRQTGLEYAKKARLDGKTIFLEKQVLLAEPDDYPDIMDVYMPMPCEDENTFAGQFLNAYEQHMGIKYGPDTFFTIDQLDAMAEPKFLSNQDPNSN